MPAGSGPSIAVVTAFAMPADTAEHAVVTLPLSNWNTQSGTQVTFNAYVTGAATGTVTFKVRQGSGTGGTAIGVAGGLVLAGVSATSLQMCSFAVQDVSAFGLAQQAGTYTLTATGSVASVATITYVLLELETVAPVQ